MIILVMAVAAIFSSEGAWAASPAKNPIIVSLTSVTSQASLGVAAGEVSGIPVAHLELEQREGASWKVVADGQSGKSGQFWLSWGLPPAGGEVTVRVVAESATGSKSGVSAAETLTFPAAAGGPVSVSGKTIVLVASAVTSAPAPGDAGTLVTSGGNLPAPGQIIVVEPGPQLPYGFIGLATRVRTDGTTVRTSTIPVSLLQAVPAGSIDATATPAEDSETDRALARELAQAVGNSVTCTGSATVTTQTSTSFSTGLQFSASWSNGSVTSASVIAEATAQLSLTDSVTGNGSCTLKPQTLASFPGPAVTAWVGYVPVVISSTIKITVSGSATASASVSAGISGGATAMVGITWSPAQGATPVASFAPVFSETAPQVNVTATVSANVTPTIRVLLDGVAGTTLSLKTGLKLTAATCGNPAWSLTLPVRFQGRLTVPALGLNTPNITLFQHSYPLATGGPACSGSGSGGSGGGTGSEAATIAIVPYGTPGVTAIDADAAYYVIADVTPTVGNSLTGSLYVISLPDATTCPATADEALSSPDAIPATEDDIGDQFSSDLGEQEFAAAIGTIEPGPEAICAYAASSPGATPYATGQSSVTVDPVGTNFYAGTTVAGQYGIVTGQITDATTGSPVSGFPVSVYNNLNSDGSYGFPGGYWTLTDNAGVYADEVVGNASYDVLFGLYPGLPGTAPTYTPCASFCGYEEQWYNDAPTFDASTPVTVPLYGTTSGINAALTPIPTDSS